MMEDVELKQFLFSYKDEIRNSADALLDQQMPLLTEELFSLFETTGNRLRYEDSYFTRRKFLTILGLEAILEEKNHIGIHQKLCEAVESVCNEETWALPAHVDRKHNPNWRITVDLFACETAQTLSELADRLYDVLPQNLIMKMTEEVLRRVLRPFFQSEVPYSWWEGAGMNWNGVCVGAIGSACIHLHNRGVELPVDFSACLARVDESLKKYIDSFPEDGACMEGLGYYTYGMSYYMNYVVESENIMGRQIQYAQNSGAVQEWEYVSPNHRKEDTICPDIMLPEKFYKIAEFPQKCFFPDGRTVSFSDGDSHDKYRMGLMAALARYDAAVQFPPVRSAAGVHTDSCYRFVELKMDLFETEQYLECNVRNRNVVVEDCVIKPVNEWKMGSCQSQENSCQQSGVNSVSRGLLVFPNAQWCIAHSKNEIGFACKGGHNNEPHNHNDIGHFIYEAGGVMFLTDLGAGEYTSDYFGEKRYEILCNSSLGHSVPIMNGKSQRQGADFQCGDFSVELSADKKQILSDAPEKKPETSEEMVVEQYCERIARIRMEIGAAYGLEPDAMIRTFRFHMDSGLLEVEDFSNLQSAFTENLITQIPPRIEGNWIYLEQGGLCVVIEIENKENVRKENYIRIVEETHRNHHGGDETVYAIQWDTVGATVYKVIFRKNNESE